MSKMSQLIEDAKEYYERQKYPARQKYALGARLAQHMKDNQSGQVGLLKLVDLVTVSKTESFEDAFKRTISAEASKKEPSLFARLTSIGNGFMLIWGIFLICAAVSVPFLAPLLAMSAAICLITLLFKCISQTCSHYEDRFMYDCSKQLQTEMEQMEAPESISSPKTNIAPNLIEPVHNDSPVSRPSDRLVDHPADRNTSTLPTGVSHSS